MGYLLDTHVVLAILEASFEAVDAKMVAALRESGRDLHVSVVSVWEIAIKTRLGKLDPKRDLDELEQALTEVDLLILNVTAKHALADLEIVPPTRDPFDQLLLAQCQVENLRLVTVDRALVGHPLAAQV